MTDEEHEAGAELARASLTSHGRLSQGVQPMWPFATPSRRRIRAGSLSIRRTRSYRPDGHPLEERCLLSVALSAGVPPAPLVGTPVTWTASSSSVATPVYQFSVAPVGGPYQMVQDFSTSNSFIWNPMQQGTFDIRVIVKDGYYGTNTESTTASYTADSRVDGTSPVVSATSNPLVALFSAPPSPGSTMYVQFQQMGSDQPWTSTASLPIVPGTSTNFLVAGMLPNTTYLMRDVLEDGTTSAPLAFTTGSLPSYLTFPTFTVQEAPGVRAELGRDIVFHVGVDPPQGTVNTLATDISGNVLWYYDPVANAFASLAPTLVPGGTALLLGGQEDATTGANTVREVDLAGDMLRQTTVDDVNAELAAMGQPKISRFSHEAQRLPNGDTAVIATTFKTIKVRGKPRLYDGDMVIVLDRNFQVSWVWNAFDWLNVHRLPSLGSGAGDWTHANSVAWSPEDNNLIVSLRSQSWVLKIDYANGTGNGHVIWKLGAGGNFKAVSRNANPWFSYQHDASYINDNTIILFDDGNIRHSKDPRAHSRGQEWVLDEKTMKARLVVNADLGDYSPALGSAQLLSSGNLDFDSGWPQQTIEVLPTGKKAYVLKMHLHGRQYRSFIYPTLYGNSAGSS